MEEIQKIKKFFTEKKIKTTPQRIAVYQAMKTLKHACAEDVIEEVRKKNPTITVGTIYNVLECLAENRIIARILTGNNKMYFDINTKEHHHLYSEKTHRIEDFEDTGLTELIRRYMNSKKIDGFKLEDIKVQLVGTFSK
ncbi:MAG: transcriptional repressor [Bacteroidales bacterium]|nr:transcriptional repressor [Bacteroidales bacterium]